MLPLPKIPILYLSVGGEVVVEGHDPRRISSLLRLLVLYDPNNTEGIAKSFCEFKPGTTAIASRQEPLIVRLLYRRPKKVKQLEAFFHFNSKFQIVQPVFTKSEKSKVKLIV